MKLITADVHSDYTVAGVFTGRYPELFIERECTFKTSIAGFKELIDSVGPNCTMVIEEGSLAAWLTRNISSCIKRFIVAEPKHNSLIFKNPEKDDSIDIRSLATLFTTNNIKEVYHTTQTVRQKFKNIVLHYADVARQVTQAKNKIKAHYLFCGMHVVASSVYHPEKRDAYIQQVSAETDPDILRDLYAVLDITIKIKEDIAKKLMDTAKQFPVIARFMKLPGVGIITAATIFAIVDTPWRFKNIKKVWKYHGLAVGRKTSNGKWLSHERLLPEGNRLLKNRIMSAAKSARRSNEIFGRLYSRKIQQGKTRSAAENEVARKLISVMWGMWKNETDYDPALI